MFHHPSDGIKVLVGEVNMEGEHPNLRWAMLRRKAFELSGGLLKTKIVIPDALVYYSTCYAPGPTPKERAVQIRQGLIGRTGYNENVSELVFDWFGDGDTVQVAVVGKETLREAIDFAMPIGLNPVAFSADPDPGQFGSEPFFDGPVEDSASDHSDVGPPSADSGDINGRARGSWSLSAIFHRFAKRRDRRATQFRVRSESGLEASRMGNRARLENVVRLSCKNAAKLFNRLVFGSLRTESITKRTIVIAFTSAVQCAAFAGPSAANPILDDAGIEIQPPLLQSEVDIDLSAQNSVAAPETGSEPVEYAPVLRPPVLEPPVAPRPRYLGGAPAIASADLPPDPALEAVLTVAGSEEMPPAQISNETAAGPVDNPAVSISPDLATPHSEAAGEPGATAAASGIVEESQDVPISADHSEADSNPTALESTPPENVVSQSAEAASGTAEPEWTSSGIAPPPSRPVLIAAIAGESAPLKRPNYISNYREQNLRSVESDQLLAGPPARPSNLRTAAAPSAKTRSSNGNRKSNETVALNATEIGALKNARLILIGVFGKPDQMKAFVRLRKGTLVSVSVGDPLDGGRVEAIREDHIVYRKGNRARRLDMPD